MANQRATFSKRNREMKLKDRAREKAERRAARKAEPGREAKGPEIAWGEANAFGDVPHTRAPGEDRDESDDAPDDTETVVERPDTGAVNGVNGATTSPPISSRAAPRQRP